MNQKVHSTQVEFNQDIFRQVVGRFASGVTVITTAQDDVPYGTTASAVSSLSMDPPMMLICLNQSSSTHDVVMNTRTYAINILADNQQELAIKFGRKGTDKFEGVDYSISEHGNVPLINGALASIVCSVVESPRGGTHSVFFGNVLEATYNAGQPLAYYRGTFGRLEQVRELEAYARVRQWILTRKTPLQNELNIEEMMKSLHVDSNDIFNALVKLTAEGFVIRNDSGAFQTTPITVKVSDSLYDGRATIEKGVVASKIREFEQEFVENLMDIADRMGELRSSPDASLEKYLGLHSEFHQALVAESGSSQLLDSYKRLSIAGVWRDAWADQDWREVLDHAHLVQLARAIKDQNIDSALDAITKYTEQAKFFAHLAIQKKGGEV